VRHAIWLSLLLVPSLASADRLLFVPTARKLPARAIAVEYRFDPTDGRASEQYIGFGLSPEFEMEIRNQRYGDRTATTFDLGFNLIPPFTGLAPGITLGAQDVLGRTEDGRRYFLAMTFREDYFGIGGEAPGDATIGVMHYRGKVHPYVGVSIPFAPQLRLMAEHDGTRLAAGFELRPVRQVGIRFIVREQNAMMGLMLNHRF
jgi:hypothetical protein